MNRHFSSQLIFNVTSLKSLTPLQLHSFLQVLIRYEQAPGGPYLFPVEDAEGIALNRHIYELFKAANKPLPNIESYLTLQSAADVPIVAKASPLSKTRVNALRRLLGNQAYNEIKHLIVKLEAVDASGELSQLSVILASCLRENDIPLDLTRQALNTIGEANFLIWIAYSLYDHLIDEAANPQLLPIANQVLRYAVKTYLMAGIPFEKINEALDVIDRANEYEVRVCRMPVKNGRITVAALPPVDELIRLQSERSLVHCFGPLYLIEKTELKKKISKITELFKEYCAVRQFNDDIHDWQEDLMNGRITYPVQWLLENSSVASGAYKLDELIPKLQQAFWEKGLVTLVGECLERSIRVRNGYYKDLGLKQQSAFDTVTIDPIISACHQALEKHSFETAFLEITRHHRSAAGSEDQQSILQQP